MPGVRRADEGLAAGAPVSLRRGAGGHGGEGDRDDVLELRCGERRNPRTAAAAPGGGGSRREEAKPARVGQVAFLRHHLDMTGEELARHLGVSKTSVSRWETGREPIGQVPDRLLRTLVILHDWDGGHDRPDIGLFASLGPGDKPSRIRVTMTGDDWRAAA